MEAQPFYCEENIWNLARTGLHQGMVVVVSNPSRTVWCRHQRLGIDVVWDYHVLMVDGQVGSVLDPDSTLPSQPFGSFWDLTFPKDAPTDLLAWFRVIESSEFLETLRSDRRHMRAADGTWRHPPPPWPVISPGAWNLDRFWDMTSSLAPGEVWPRDQVCRRLELRLAAV